MLKSKWVSFIFILALAFDISIARSITPDNCVRANSADSHSSHHQEHNKSKSRSASELQVLAHLSSSDFISGAQVNLCPIVNLAEDDEYDEDEEDCLLQVPCLFLVVPSPYKLFFPTHKSCGPPSSQLLLVLP